MHIATLVRVPRRMIQWQNMLVLVVKTYMKYRSIRKIKQIDIWGGKNEVLGFVVAFVASTRGSPVPYKYLTFIAN